jgi:uncharacterized membrane protein
MAGTGGSGSRTSSLILAAPSNADNFGGVAKIRETVEIDAPVERVWAVVHEDFKNAARWSNNVDRIEELTDGPFGKGTELRYVLSTPGGKQQLEVEHTTVTAGKTVAGKFIRGPIKGTWKYSYAQGRDGTKLTYTMDYEPNGIAARIFFGIIERQLPNDVERTLTSLKQYIESGKGPKRSVSLSAAKPKK